MIGIILVVIALVFIVVAVKIMKSVSAKKKEEQQREQEEIEREREIEQNKLNEGIEIAKDIVKQTYESQYNFLNNALLSDQHYFTYFECEKFKSDTNELHEMLGFLKQNDEYESLDENAKKLYTSINEINKLRTEHNKRFVEKELVENKEFFDSALSYPLDPQQRESIVKLEDNCLVISSAGSGKTSTMIGKLLYLVNVRRIQPSRILTITYTRKAADELTQRLMGTGLSCLTFHKLAMNIISKVEDKVPSFADNGLFIKVFYNMLNDDDFRNAILNYLTDFRSLVKNEHDYENSVEYYLDRKKYGIIALYPDKDGKIIATKSEEEKKICSYLTELGVKFKYEEPYEHKTYTEDYRQYKPDFTIYYTDSKGNEKKVYLEHYALDMAGNVPQWFGNNAPDGWIYANDRYHEAIDWKKQLHEEYGTVLIYTTSADFHNNNIRTRLRTILSKVGVPLRDVSVDELIEKIMSRSKSLENALLQMTQSFINLVKANDKSLDDIIAIANARGDKRDVFVIDKIMKPLWLAYNKELADRDEIDFTDAIVKATKYCNENKWNQKYEYILVDEFQDISTDRYNFLKSLRTENPNTKLYCVGDDWQSIYRFTGSDMSLFVDFAKYFGYTEECKIETTYRFGNPLVNESSRFVQRNPLQKKKKVHPLHNEGPQTKISFMGYEDNEELQKLIIRMIARVPDDKTAYIISRYSYDVNALICPDIKMGYDKNTDNVKLTIGNRVVRFMTIHGSKGLEADYVFVLNCNSGLYGFPSLVSDDPVLDYVLSNPEHYEYSEERRVFYVGITRAKVHTVVMYDKNNPSPFVTEMNEDIATNTNPCPLCEVGHRIIKYEGWTKQNRPYRVWGCDNLAANCQYFEREFSNGSHMELTGKKYRTIGLGKQ